MFQRLISWSKAVLRVSHLRPWLSYLPLPLPSPPPCSYLEPSQVTVRRQRSHYVAANHSLMTQQGQQDPQEYSSHFILLLLRYYSLHCGILYTRQHTHTHTHRYSPRSRQTEPVARRFFVDRLKCILTPRSDKAAGQMSL